MSDGPLTRRRQLAEHAADTPRPYAPWIPSDCPEPEYQQAKSRHAAKVRAAERDRRLIEEGEALLAEYQGDGRTTADAFGSYMADLLERRR